MAISQVDNTLGAGEPLNTGFDKVNQAITRVNQFDALSAADIAQLGVYASVLLTATELNRLDGDLATVQGNLGLAIGSDVQAWNEGLDEISGLIPFANDFLVYDTEWKAKTPAQSRLALNVYSKSESDLRYLQQGGASLAGVGLTWNVTSEKLDVNADLSHVTGLGTLTELTVGNINKNGGIVYTDANGKLQNSSNATLGASGKATLNSLEVTTTSNLIGNVTLGNQASTTSHAVRADRLISAGNGLTGGGNLISDRTLTLGTPSTLTVSTTNNASASSHTHTLDLSGRKLTIANDSDNIITWGSLNEQNLGSDRTWTPTLRDAGKNVRGVVSAGTQTFGGVKTFSDVGTFETDLYVDRNLYVKGGLFATEFIVNQTRVQFDNAMSVGGGKISTVSGSVGSEVITFEDENGTKFVPVAENDIIHIQKRTGFASGTIIKNIWRRVTGINGNLIQLGTSNISWSTSNDVGVVIAGDDCVVKGNTTNAARQHYTLYDLSSAKAPRRIMYDNVTDVEDDGDIVLMDGNMDGNYGITGREFGMAVGDTTKVGNHFVLSQNEGSLKMDTFNLSAGSGSNFVGVNSGTLPFFAGATNNSGASAKFSVTSAGKLTSTSGAIGGATINSTYLSYTVGTVNAIMGSANPLYINGFGFHVGMDEDNHITMGNYGSNYYIRAIVDRDHVFEIGSAGNKIAGAYFDESKMRSTNNNGSFLGGGVYQNWVDGEMSFGKSISIKSDSNTYPDAQESISIIDTTPIVLRNFSVPTTGTAILSELTPDNDNDVCLLGFKIGVNNPYTQSFQIIVTLQKNDGGGWRDAIGSDDVIILDRYDQGAGFSESAGSTHKWTTALLYTYYDIHFYLYFTPEASTDYRLHIDTNTAGSLSLHVNANKAAQFRPIVELNNGGLFFRTADYVKASLDGARGFVAWKSHTYINKL